METRTPIRWFTKGGKHIPVFEDDLSDEEKQKALATYQSTAFDAINTELRYDVPDRYKEVIKTLDRMSIDETDDLLYRGLDQNFAKYLKDKYKITNIDNLDEIRKKLVGKTIVDKGFASASVDMNDAVKFANTRSAYSKGMYTVIIYQGKKRGINTEKYGKVFFRREKEFIIKRGTPFHISRVGFSKTGKLLLWYSQVP